MLLWFGNLAKQECILCLYSARFLSEYPKNAYHCYERAMAMLLGVTGQQQNLYIVLKVNLGHIQVILVI